MKVLLTNDDGGPNDLASPYVKFLVEAILRHTNWQLTICVPFSQKSWIGKAHFAGKDVTIKYIYSTVDNPEDNSYHGPFPFPQEKMRANKSLMEWCLVDNGTPATSTDIGINHICGYDNVDLVISGPNVGRNSTALYALSSGTVGGAMEGCHHGKKSVALSYAYEKQYETPAPILREASLMSVRIIEQLYNEWPKDEVDLYTINVPLNEQIKTGVTKIVKAPLMENRWQKSLYTPVKNSGNNEHADIVDQSVTNGTVFKWSPDFDIVHKDIAKSIELTDGKVVDNGHVSVSALKASFKHAASFNSGEMVLKLQQEVSKLSIDEKNIVITIPKSSYVYEPLMMSIKKYLPTAKIYNKIPNLKDTKLFHYGEYEDLDHERLMMDLNYMANSYIYRKSLIRKHYLSNTIDVYTSKHPESILNKCFPESYQFELDFAEFLDDVLDEVYELRCALKENEKDLAKTFILKPSMSDKGQGIRLFQTIDQLQAVFDSFDEDDTDDEGDMNDNGIIISQLRHFVVQEYVSRPLLLPEYQNRKFHIRTYVLASNNLKVYVNDRMLMLFSEHSYQIPNTSDSIEIIDMAGHLTNTCLQNETDRNIVVEFGKSVIKDDMKKKVLKQIHEIVGELFKAAVTVDKINFQPLPNAFEVYGLDFLVDDKYNVTLLEVNAYPDFKQTGDSLKSLIYELFDGVIGKSVVPFFGGDVVNGSNMCKVLELTAGRL